LVSILEDHEIMHPQFESVAAVGTFRKRRFKAFIQHFEKLLESMLVLVVIKENCGVLPKR
jgi:hypothetical protein